MELTEMTVDFREVTCNVNVRKYPPGCGFLANSSLKFNMQLLAKQAFDSKVNAIKREALGASFSRDTTAGPAHLLLWLLRDSEWGHVVAADKRC